MTSNQLAILYSRCRRWNILQQYDGHVDGHVGMIELMVFGAHE